MLGLQRNANSERNAMKSSGWIMYAVVASFVFILIITTGAFAEDEANLAKQAQNPIANLISLPLQNNTNFGIGPEDETQNILNIQPVLPFGITESLNLITRTILPVVSQPDILTGGEGRINGLGDTTQPSPLLFHQKNQAT
jgi:hypothetical protein